MTLRVPTPAHAALQAIRACLHDGQLVKPRGIECLELLNATIVVDRPWQIPFELPGRGMRAFIGAVEALQLVGQTHDPELVSAGSPPMAKYKDHGVFHGGYGQRVYGRLGPIVELLKKDPESRQAVLSIYDATRDLGFETKDVPCTLTIQFFVREGRLCARTSMRSNDVWLGMPYDLIQFCALQGAVAAGLGLPMGWYAHTVGSMHLYKSDAEKAEQVAAHGRGDTEQSYRPLWTGNTIADISRTARLILAGSSVDGFRATLFEAWLNKSIEAVR